MGARPSADPGLATTIRASWRGVVGADRLARRVCLHSAASVRSHFASSLERSCRLVLCPRIPVHDGGLVGPGAARGAPREPRRGGQASALERSLGPCDGASGALRASRPRYTPHSWRRRASTAPAGPAGRRTVDEAGGAPPAGVFRYTFGASVNVPRISTCESPSRSGLSVMHSARCPEQSASNGSSRGPASASR